MKLNFSQGAKLLAILLIVAGIGGLALALGTDRFGAGGQAGVGLRQGLLAIASAGLVAFGLLMLTPPVQAQIRIIIGQIARGAPPAPISVLAVWAGLATGLAEAAILGFQKLFQGKIIFRSVHFPWMSPVGYTLIFGAIGALLALVLLRASRPRSQRIGLFVLAFLSFASLATLFPRLNLTASLVLALGLAVQATRLAFAHLASFSWLVRRTLPLLAAIVVMLAVGLYGWQSLAERQALADLPDAAPNAPNVVLITLDTVRAGSLSLHGYERSTTPNLEKLAGQGVWFQNAFATSSWTLPSHASMFTGRWHFEQSVDWSRPLDQTYPTLAEALARRGYRTAGFVANTTNCGWEVGLNRGFARYEDYTNSPVQILLTTSLARIIEAKLEPALGENRLHVPKTAGMVNSSFLRWLDRQPERPFFAFLNYWDAHGPYQPPAPYNTRFGDPSLRANPYQIDRINWSPEQVQAEVDAYDGAIAYLDAQIGRLYAELEQRGLAENTLVIITSDHGEQFGEHRLFGHANSLYVSTLHVPLVILFPGRVPEGVAPSQPVSQRNLPATILDLLQLKNPWKFPGTSLAHDWQMGIGSGGNPGNTEMILSEIYPGSEHEDFAPLARGKMKSLVLDHYHYILNGDGQEELYDLEADYAEDRNLVDDETARAILNQFRDSLGQISLQASLIHP